MKLRFTHQEFSVKSLKDTTFRVAEITPVEILAISNQVDLDNYKMTKELYTFVFEHTEVSIGGKWLPVKTKDKEVYWPQDVENNLEALNEIFMWMMKEIITQVFPKSSK